MITNFENFINESYLEGGRQPLYHITRGYNFMEILKSDKLKSSSNPMGDDSICVTRSSTYDTDDINGKIDARFVLDADKLKNDGHKIYPYDELGDGAKNSKKVISKVDYTFRPPVHNLNLPESEIEKRGLAPFGIQYEERLPKTIEKLGKYLIAIDLSEDTLNRYKDDVKKYLEKYPHIKLVKLINGKYWDRTKEFDLEKEFSKEEEKDLTFKNRT